jgi:hypothetical protein
VFANAILPKFAEKSQIIALFLQNPSMTALCFEKYINKGETKCVLYLAENALCLTILFFSKPQIKAVFYSI